MILQLEYDFGDKVFVIQWSKTDQEWQIEQKTIDCVQTTHHSNGEASTQWGFKGGGKVQEEITMYSTMEEAEQTVEALQKSVKMLQKFGRIPYGRE